MIEVVPVPSLSSAPWTELQVMAATSKTVQKNASPATYPRERFRNHWRLAFVPENQTAASNGVSAIQQYLRAGLIDELHLVTRDEVDQLDVAEIATWAAVQTDNMTLDAAGPDTVTYAELVEGIAIAVGRRPHFFVMPPRLTLWAADIVSRYKRDIMLTRQELQGLMDELLVSSEKPRGTRRIDNWLLTNADLVGRTYASELDRHWR